MIAVANKLKVEVSIENIAFLFKTGRNINRSLGVRAVGTGGELDIIVIFKIDDAWTLGSWLHHGASQTLSLVNQECWCLSSLWTI